MLNVISTLTLTLINIPNNPIPNLNPALITRLTQISNKNTIMIGPIIIWTLVISLSWDWVMSAQSGSGPHSTLYCQRLWEISSQLRKRTFMKPGRAPHLHSNVVHEWTTYDPPCVIINRVMIFAPWQLKFTAINSTFLIFFFLVIQTNIFEWYK